VALPPGGRAVYFLSSLRSCFEGYRGYRRIQGALANLGHELARGMIANILKEHGPEPAPEGERKTTWKELLSRHREVTVAADFFTIEAWTRKGLTTFLVLFLIDLSSRRVEIAGVTREANGLWMSQVARNLSDAEEGFLTGSGT
jgi:putative transposase